AGDRNSAWQASSPFTQGQTGRPAESRMMLERLVNSVSAIIMHQVASMAAQVPPWRRSARMLAAIP
ncbi:MAG TPA: hypothetical protein VMT24_15065, partial [Aggregatilineaceae bacterium]|nr:hypothetical protein [Aggregatilineaceae bacterium]